MDTYNQIKTTPPVNEAIKDLLQNRINEKTDRVGEEESTEIQDVQIYNFILLDEFEVEDEEIDEERRIV